MSTLLHEEAATEHWRLAAGLTVDDRAGALQVYVAESQRGFVVAGVAAEIILDLLAFARFDVDEGIVRERFVEYHVARHDRTRLDDAWSAAVKSGILVAIPGVEPGDRTARGLALLGNAGVDVAALLRRELLDLGVELADEGDRPLLVIGLDDVGDDDGLVELGRALPWDGVPYLPVQLLHQRLGIGPLVFPGDTACFECALTRRAAGLMPDGVRRWGRVPVVRPGELERRAGAKVAAAVVRHQAQSLLLDEPPSLTGRRLTHDLAAASQQTSFVLEVPGCRTCRLTDGLLR